MIVLVSRKDGSLRICVKYSKQKRLKYKISIRYTDCVVVWNSLETQRGFHGRPELQLLGSKQVEVHEPEIEKGLRF